MPQRERPKLKTASRLAALLIALALIASCQTTSRAQGDDQVIFRWDSLRYAGTIDGGMFDNGFGTLIASPRGLEHRGYRVLSLSWEQIEWFRLAPMDNLITIDLVKGKEHCELTALIDYSRYRFEVIHHHLERLRDRYIKKAPTAEDKPKSSGD
jgi:hypothetical protein